MSTTNNPENTTVGIDLISLPVVTVREIYTFLNEHLTYLIDLHKKYIVCYTKKEKIDKEVLESKITALTNRVVKLKAQLDKHSKDE